MKTGKTNQKATKNISEKDLLLSLSEDMTTIRDRDDLFRTISRRLRSVYKFQAACVTTYSPDLTHYRHLLVDPSDKLGAHPLYSQIVGDFFLPLADTPDAYILERFAEDDVYYWHTAEMGELYPEHPIIPLLKESDLHHNVHTALRYQGQIIGFFHIHYTDETAVDKSLFKLLRAIAKQMAAAVANILANEEILERTREKSVLLSISEDIASARNAVELLQIICDKAQNLIPFYDTGILIVEESGGYHYDLAVNLPGWDDSEVNLRLQAAKLNRIPHQGSYLADVMKFLEQADGPIIHDWTAAFEQAEHPFFVTLEELGYKEGIVAALKSGGKTFGTLWLNSLEKNNFNPAQFVVFQALADQIAVAVSNILANEEIERQLAEIKRLKDRLESENSYLVEEVKTNYNFEEIIGSAAVLRNVFEQIELVAPTDSTVLLEGETGTGKELFARAIHNLSPRGKRALIKVNCACLPAQLVESELFGHERGAFTGASERRIGKFELAHNGTIFLDEIGELELDLQAKLLRVLQEREVERIGGKSPLRLNVRVIAATNRNLRDEVAAKRFRSDLYFRLNTVTLGLPSLRERREDVPALAMHFVEKYANRTGKRIKSIATDALRELMSYDFPGNVRELEHLIEEAVIFCRGDKLVLHRPLLFNNLPPTVENFGANLSIQPKSFTENERENILAVLRQTGGRIRGEGGAAEILELKPTTLESRMKRLGIEKHHSFTRP